MRLILFLIIALITSLSCKAQRGLEGLIGHSAGRPDSLYIAFAGRNLGEYQSFLITYDTIGALDRNDLQDDDIRQMTLMIDYLENYKGIQVPRVNSESDFREGVLTKREEYYERILEAVQLLD